MATFRKLEFSLLSDITCLEAGAGVEAGAGAGVGMKEELVKNLAWLGEDQDFSRRRQRQVR